MALGSSPRQNWADCPAGEVGLDFMPSSDQGKRLQPGPHQRTPLWSSSCLSSGTRVCTARAVPIEVGTPSFQTLFRYPGPCNSPPKWPGAHFPSPVGGLFPGSCSWVWTGCPCEHRGPRGSSWQRLGGRCEASRGAGRSGAGRGSQGCSPHASTSWGGTLKCLKL